MEEQYDGDDVHSTRKLKLKGPYLEHSRIRTQESVRQGDEEAGTSESRRLQPIVIKPKQKDLPPEPARIKTTANIHQCDEFGQTEMVTSGNVQSIGY